MKYDFFLIIVKCRAKYFFDLFQRDLNLDDSGMPPIRKIPTARSCRRWCEKMLGGFCPGEVINCFPRNCPPGNFSGVSFRTKFSDDLLSLTKDYQIQDVKSTDMLVA